MTSGDPAISRDQAERLKQAGIDFVDAPVSGGPRGAREGVIAIMVGGDAALYARAIAFAWPHQQQLFPCWAGWGGACAKSRQ